VRLIRELRQDLSSTVNARDAPRAHWARWRFAARARNSDAGGIASEKAIVKGKVSTLGKKAGCIVGTPSISDVPT
jgi:hypothetical protein